MRRLSINKNALFLLAVGVVAIVGVLDDPATGGKPDHAYGLAGAEILIIRHAEKPDSGPGLSQAGRDRADAYVDFFQHFMVKGRPLHLDNLFATADSGKSQRPRLTLAPLGHAVKLPVDTRFKNNQIRDLVLAIQSLPPGRQILICWHHGEIPDLLRALGGNPEKIIRGAKWPDSVFSWLIALRYDQAGQLLDARCLNAITLPKDTNYWPHLEIR